MTQAQKQFKAAQADELRRRNKMLVRLRAMAPEPYLIAFGVSLHVLLPGTDDLSDWPAHLSPRTESEMQEIEGRLVEFLER